MPGIRLGPSRHALRVGAVSCSRRVAGCLPGHRGMPLSPFSPVGAAAAGGMIVTPGPDLLAGRHVAVAAGPLACGGMRRGHETLRAGMQNLVCHLSITVRFPPDGDKPRVMDTLGPVTNGAGNTSGGAAPSTPGGRS